MFRRFAADALTARLVVKKFFFRFCSDKFLVKGFLLTWESPAGVDDTRRTEDLIEPTAVTCVGVDFERACSEPALAKIISNVALRPSSGSRRRSSPFSSIKSKTYRKTASSWRR